jgi:hypothetical protein
MGVTGPAGSGGGGGVCDTECAPVTMASDQHSPFYIAADAKNVYWTTWRPIDPNGTVKRAPLSGGVPVMLTTDVGPGAIAVDATSLYWASPQQYTITKMPIDGHSPTVMASGSDAESAFAIAVDSMNVYWTTGRGAVMQMPTGGGTPIAIASDQGFPRGIAVDATSVYFTTFDTGTVKKVPIGGGIVTTLASGQDAPAAIVVHGDTAYWLNAKSLMAVNIDGGMPYEVTSAAVPRSIAVDDSGVYWTNYQPLGKVLKVPFDGGPMITLARDQDGPAAIVVQGDSVLWSNANAQATGTIMRLGKCKNGRCV